MTGADRECVVLYSCTLVGNQCDVNTSFIVCDLSLLVCHAMCSLVDLCASVSLHVVVFTGGLTFCAVGTGAARPHVILRIWRLLVVLALNSAFNPYLPLQPLRGQVRAVDCRGDGGGGGRGSSSPG
jgi:hypothetical protein